MASQKFGEQDKEQAETLGLALELYRRQREKQHFEEAAQQTLNELEIPSEFMQEAQAEIQRAKKYRDSRRAVTKFFVVVIALCAGFIYLGSHNNWFSDDSSSQSSSSSGSQKIYDPPNTSSDNPIETLHVSPSTTGTPWEFSVNADSDAQFTKESEHGTAFDRVLIRSLAPQHNAPADTKFYVCVSTPEVRESLKGASELSFTARSNGVQRVIVRFSDKNNEYWSQPFDLTKDWKTYKVDLDRLTRDPNGDDDKGDVAIRVPDVVDYIQFNLGSRVNDQDTKGTFDLKDADVH